MGNRYRAPLWLRINKESWNMWIRPSAKCIGGLILGLSWIKRGSRNPKGSGIVKNNSSSLSSQSLSSLFINKIPFDGIIDTIDALLRHEIRNERILYKFRYFYQESPKSSRAISGYACCVDEKLDVDLSIRHFNLISARAYLRILPFFPKVNFIASRGRSLCTRFSLITGKL